MTAELARIRKDTFRQALAEGIKELPFVAAVLAVLSGAFRSLNEARFQDFLECVGKPLGCDDFEAASKYVEENIDQPWMIEGLERGWRAALETLDPLARRCAYVMVADYMAQKREPDRLHRQFAHLLAEVDKATLAPLLRMADGVFEVGEQRVNILLGRASGGESGFYAAASGWPPQYIASTDIRWLFDDLVSILVRNRFLSEPGGFGSSHDFPPGFERGQKIAFVDEYQRGLWDQLRKYLEPVRQV
jgi:hypothetical protein